MKRAGLDWEMGRPWDGREDRGLPGEVVLRDLAGPLSISFPPDQEIPHLEPEILGITNRKLEELWGESFSRKVKVPCFACKTRI